MVQNSYSGLIKDYVKIPKLIYPFETYTNFSSLISWNEANKECEQLNMTLPSIHSDRDMDNLFRLNSENMLFYERIGMYIGLNLNVHVYLIN